MTTGREKDNEHETENSNSKNMKDKEKLFIATWNVRGTFEEGAIKRLTNELKKYKVDVVALQETKQKGNDISDINGYTFFKSGGADRRLGSGFMVSDKIRAAVVNFQPISDRISCLRLKGKYQNISLVNIHAPTEKKQLEVKEQFYETVDKIYEKIPKYDLKIVLGDCNAEVGREIAYQPTIGKYSLHEESNENGRLLVDFAMSRDMKIKSTHYQHKEIHKGTWMSPDGNTINQIDHVLIENRGEACIKDVRSYRGPDMDSDHFLVGVKLQQIIPTNKITKKINRKRFKKLNLQDKPTQEKYKEIMNNMLQIEKEHLSIEERLKEIHESIEKVVNEIGSNQKNIRQEWYDIECEYEVKEKEKARQLMLQSGTAENKRKYEDQRRKCKALCREKKRKHKLKMLEELEEKYKNKEIRNFYQGTKRVKRGHQPRTSMCKDKQGNLIGDTQKIKERWAEYFEELLNIQRGNGNASDNGPLHDENEDNEQAPENEEIEKVIQQLKNNRCAGADEIQAEMVKHGGKNLQNMLCKLIQEIWRKEEMPREWKEAIICPLFKKGEKENCENYRGIALLSVLYKILATCIKNKLVNHAENKLGEYQSGFRRGRSVVDQIYTLKEIQATSYQHKLQTHLLFIDFKQAYDSIEREQLYRALNNLQIPRKLIRLIRMTLQDTINMVKVNGELSRKFIVRSGLRQGDPLSAVLFNLALESTIRTSGINRQSTLYHHWHQCVAFADDLTILTRTKEELRNVTKKIVLAAREMGLKINESKTKYMVWSDNQYEQGGQLTVKVDQNKEYRFKEVETFTYLGTVMTRRPGSEEEIKARISAGSKSAFALKSVISGNMFSRAVKLRIYKTIIRPVVMYGSEVWTLKKREQIMLGVWERKILRKIFGGKKVDGIWERRTNKELQEMYSEADIIGVVKAQRIRWLGHLIRMGRERVPNKIWTADVGGRRRQGRPRSQWKTEVQEDLNRLHIQNWREKATNRKEWALVARQAMGLRGP